MAEGQNEQLVDAYAYRPGQAPRMINAGASSKLNQGGTFDSGGGGLIGTIEDYHRFATMLLNGGELDGARIISPKTLRLMRTNHLPGNADLTELSSSLFSEANNAGTGFGLGFAMVIDPARTLMPSSLGEFYWGGAYSTAFFVDPVERITMVFMTQVYPSSTYPIRRQLKTLIYSALTETMPEEKVTSPIRTERHDNVVISDNPPVNALGQAAGRAQGRDRRSWPMTASRQWSSAATARPSPALLNSPRRPEPARNARWSQRQAGGGRDAAPRRVRVALACHYRVAVPSARKGSAAGTQRLPSRRRGSRASAGRGRQPEQGREDRPARCVGGEDSSKPTRSPLPRQNRSAGSASPGRRMRRCPRSRPSIVSLQARRIRGFDAPMRRSRSRQRANMPTASPRNANCS